MSYDLLVIGGGAAGFFGAIHAAAGRSGLRVAILERGAEVLEKVRISGGGRCNVTHAEYDPRELATHYPRGKKELLGPFHTYACGDTQAFFEDRGVPLKVEADGRIFPVSDDSGQIIDCLLKEAEKLGIKIFRKTAVRRLEPGEGYWDVHSAKDRFRASRILLATGSNPKIWALLQGLGHTIVPPVPSLFTFNISDPRLEGLQGLATPAAVRIELPPQGNGARTLEREGPVLITHWGLSGPAILKLSAWGARQLHQCNYHFRLVVNWLPQWSGEAVSEVLTAARVRHPKKLVSNTPLGDLPRRLWSSLVAGSGIAPGKKWADLNRGELDRLREGLASATYQVEGKSTFKEEFVTAGGVSLKEIDFRTFESRVRPGLYLAGEILDIDAITGGFNFQNAWTGSYIAARALLNSLEQERQ